MTTKKIVIITLPGIGTQEAGFDEKFREDVNRFTKGLPVHDNYEVIGVRPFYYSETDDYQNQLMKRLGRSNKLGGNLSLREFALKAFGDAVVYEHGAYKDNSVYQRVHSYLKQKIEEANQLLSDFDKGTIVVVASSLGGHILSNYLYDVQKGKGIFANNNANENCNLHNLSYLVTLGCNIPLFVSGYPQNEIVPFSKPNESFQWDNYYDRDDVLGWPLKDLSPAYSDLVEDHEINTGLYIGSHLRYWKDNDFTRPFSRKLNEIYGAL